MKATNKFRAATALLSAALLLQGCVVGPRYNRPAVQTPGTFKEVTADDLKKMDGWKLAQPQDSTLHGKWWELLGDPQLNALEERVDISNQNVASAFANFMAARAVVREARAQYFPTVTAGASITRQRQVTTGTNGKPTGTISNEYSMPFDASWTPDLWGRGVESLPCRVTLGSRGNAGTRPGLLLLDRAQASNHRSHDRRMRRD